MPRLTTQAEVTNPRRKGYDFRIDNQLYRAAISGDRQMTIQSSDIQEQGVNVKQNPEDFTSNLGRIYSCLLYTSPSPRDLSTSRMPSSA